MTTAKPFPHWNTGCKPPDEMLSTVYSKNDYEVIGEHFLTDRSGRIRTEQFRRDKTGGFTGYWANGTEPDRWMQLPPVGEDQ